MLILVCLMETFAIPKMFIIFTYRIKTRIKFIYNTRRTQSIYVHISTFPTYDTKFKKEEEARTALRSLHIVLRYYKTIYFVFLLLITPE